jgi:two-component system CheB/CheR fusion protein
MPANEPPVVGVARLMAVAAPATLWWRVAATAAMAVTFALDLKTAAASAMPVLYIGSVLLFLRIGRAWEPFFGASLATALTAAATAVSPATDELLDRGLALLAVWLAAVVTASHRRLATQQEATDVERHAAERDKDAVHRKLEQFKYALDQSAIVAITDQHGTITYANDKFCEISKYSRDELVGQDHRIVNSAYHPKEFIRTLWRTIAQGGVWRGEIRNRAKDGSFYWVDTTIVPLLDERGKPREYLAIRSDITERKAAEVQLREQAALAQLGELAAIVAHEVRNPLAGLRGSLQVLGTRLPPEMRERQIIGTMVERIDALNERVRDILLFAGTSRAKLQPVTVAPILTDVVASARAAVPRVVRVELSGPSPAVVADPEMLREVLLNLVLNACQASPADSPVEICTSLTDGACRIEILDRGPGIPEEIRDRVFEPFFTTKHGGTGLGLAIVKRLVELQNGAVSLADRRGGGTIGAISLPLHRGQ